MIRLYYKIWADALAYERSKKGRENNWKTVLITAMSILQGINLFAIFMLLRLLSGGRYLILFPVHIFNSVGYNSALSVLITYFIPFVIINYLFVFYNNSHEQIVKAYGNKGGKLYGRYAMISIGVIVIPLVFKLIFL